MTNVIGIIGAPAALTGNGKVIWWGSALETVYNLSKVVAIAEGGDHSLALKSHGTMVAWGNNNYGQGIVPLGLSNVMAIAAGGSHNLALRTNGTVVAWGWNLYGQTNVPSG